MKKVIVSLAIAALCFCACCNNNGGKKVSEGEAAAVEAVADSVKACCGECQEGEACEKCQEEGACENCEKADDCQKAE